MHGRVGGLVGGKKLRKGACDLLGRVKNVGPFRELDNTISREPSFADPVKLTGAKLPDGLSVSSRARSPARTQRCATTPLSLCCASGSFT